MTALSMTSNHFRNLPASALAPYGELSRAERYIHQTRDAALLTLLARRGVSLQSQRILELGCGSGSFLQTLLTYGANRKQLTGIDLDSKRVRTARDATIVSTAVADGALLPYRSDAFDMVFMFTSLSSITDVDVRRHAAHEAMRVLRAGGIAVIYDFWTNPFNSGVTPISAAELRHLFEPRTVEVERVTLAPPIVRLLGGREALCRPLERFLFLRTHLLASVVKEAQHG